MKHQHLLKTVGLILCLGATAGRAQYYSDTPSGAGPYFRVGLGPSFFEDGRLTQFGGPANSKVEFNTGFAGDAAIGYAFNQYIAADFEVGGVGAEIKSVPGFYTRHTYLDNVSYLANVTLSCPIPRTIVVPYIGVGAGGSTTVFDTDGFGNNFVTVFGNDTDTVFAWQARAGLRFRLNSQMSLGVGYKYFATEDSSFGYGPGFPGGGPNLPISFDGVRTHSVMVTFQMNF
jgi:opacity protein-like surface antigen